jgi:hypothetical protein
LKTRENMKHSNNQQVKQIIAPPPWTTAAPLLTTCDPMNAPRADGRALWQASGRLAADAPYDSLGRSIYRVLCLLFMSGLRSGNHG